MRPMPDLVKQSISHATYPMNYPTCMAITEHVVKAADQADRIIIYYNEFLSAISFVQR